MPKAGKLRAIDLCCGAGGWACAARGLPIEFIACVDLADDCLETWRTNHRADHPDCQLKRIDLSDPVDSGAFARWAVGQNIDLILGGIPCEQVSIMRQSPLSDESLADWHRLIDHCLMTVQACRAPYWCFEDVIQIDRHLPGPLLYGSEITVRRIDASLYGPQKRIRSFFGAFPPPTPPGDGARRTLRDCLRPGPHLTIAAEETFERLRYPGRAITLLSGDATARVLDLDSPAPTVLAGGPHRGQRQRRNWCVEDDRGRLRVLSLQEFAAIQGFPEDFLFSCGACRAQEMVGRAIPIYVGRAILKAILADHRTREAANAAEGGEA